MPLPRKSWLWAPALLAAGAGSAWLFVEADWARSLADPARARRDGRPIPVRTFHVTEAEMERVVGGTAITRPSREVAIRVDFSKRRATAPACDLVLKAVHPQDGDRVEQGQLLFELEDRVFRQIVRQQEAALAGAEKMQNARDGAVQGLEQMSGVLRGLQTKGASGAIEVLQARALQMQARADLAEAERLLKTAEVDLEVARQDVARCQIRCPIAGFFCLAEPDPPGGSAPGRPVAVPRTDLVPGTVLESPSVLAHVLQLDPIHVVMDLPQERMGEVYLGQQAEVVLDGFPQETFRGSVVRLLPRVNPELRTLPVVIEVKNPDCRIRAGVSGYVRLRTTQTATVVPTAAVLRRESKAMVFRVEDGRARLREVTLGPLVRTGLREVRGGLKDGDEVVLFHNFYRHAGDLTAKGGFLRDNDPVDPDWERWARRD